MLTPEQAQGLQVAFERLTDPVTDYLVRDVARRVSEAGQLTSTAAYQIWRLQELGKSLPEVEAEVAELLNKQVEEANKLFIQAAEVGYDFDIDRLHPEAVPFAENTSIQQITAAAVKLADKDFRNITQTIGFVGPDGKARPLTDAYLNAADEAFNLIISGTTDYNTAIRKACAKLASEGIRSIDYASGVHTSLEAAVRRDMMGGLGLMVEQISQHNHDDLGANGWEIDAHAASAPDHEPIQGRQYSDEAYKRLNESLHRRIGTLNCGHNDFPIILGVNAPQYTQEELDWFREDNAKGADYEGRHFETKYKATQYQRRIENSIRAQKRRVMVSDSQPDTERRQQDKTRLNALQAEYRRFCKSTGLRAEDERLFVSGFGKKQREKTVDILPKRDTIKNTIKAGEGTDVHSVASIDIEKYRCISKGITTDEVIITDERIQHIRDRHPNDFERYESYLAEIVEDPDYILEANKPNTAFLLKEIHESEERFQLILRLAVQGDQIGHKNSIITFLRVEEKRYKRYLRTKNILYKKE